MKAANFLKLTVAVLCITSCSIWPFSTAKSTPPPAMDKLGIIGAKGLFIGSGTSASKYRVEAMLTRPDYTKSSLLRVNADYSIAPVSAMTASNQPFAMPTNVFPVDLFELNSDYLCLSLIDNNPPHPLTGFHLLRKSDGKLAHIGYNTIMTCDRYMRPNPPVQTDSNGNFYCITYHFERDAFRGSAGTLVKATVQPGTDRVVLTELSNYKMEGIGDFAVDAQGNVLASGFNGSSEFTKLYKASGGIQIIKDRCVAMWTGKNGSIYYYADSPTSNGERGIKKVAIDASGNAVCSLIPNTGTWRCEMNGSLIIRSGDKLVSILLRSDLNPNQILTFSESNEQVTSTNLKNVATIEKIQADGSSFYVLGRDASDNLIVDQYDANTGNEKVFYAVDPNYAVYEFFVSGKELILSAQRLTDSAYVVGRVQEDGSLSLLQSSFPQVTSVVMFQ